MKGRRRARWVGRFVSRLAGPLGAFDAVRLGRALGSVQEARALASDLQSAALHFMARPARSDLDELRASLDRTQRRLDRMERNLNERND